MSRSIQTEDRISALPDPIIYLILSFLPTKLSAATSILSKRWKPLWLSVPTLHFDDETFPNYDSYFRFASSVFLLRDITLPIRSFHLKFSQASTHHSHDINLFVYAAAQRGGIENINLEISSSMLFLKVDLPTSIFSCRTLVVLHLKGLRVNDLCQLVVHFPLLKTLHLRFMRFDVLEDLVKLLSGCPILEELQIEWVYGAELLGLVENSQSLPNLIKAKVSYFSSTAASVLFALLCKAKVLCVELEDIGYNHFPMFQKLIHMELIIKHNRCEKWEWVIEVLKRCPKLQNLTIDENSRNEKEVVDNWMNPTTVPD